MPLTSVPSEEHILVDSWEKLCEGLPGLVYMSVERVGDFFKKCEQGSVGQCVLVSGYCDISIQFQEENHPNADLFDLAASAEWSTLRTAREHYHSLKIGPACDTEKCRLQDRYSGKIDRHTFFTFDEVPANILRWYTVNLDVEHPRMEWLPFGLNNDGHGSSILPDFAGREKKGLLYVNFQPNTLERVKWKNLFSSLPWVTYREDVPVEQYLAEVAEHKFVLCPFGNGLDCYRTYEAMYLGSVPVLTDSVFSSYMLGWGLPVMSVDNYSGLTPALLSRVWSDVEATTPQYRAVTKSHWRECFQKDSGRI